MKKNFLASAFLVGVLGLTGCISKTENSSFFEKTEAVQSETTTAKLSEDSNTYTTSEKVLTKEYFITLDLDSQSIAKNQLGDTSKRNIYVYLPPSYYESDTKYPVVYYLDGYDCSSMSYLKGQISKLDNEFNSGKDEFIMVALDGNNKTGGSFYVNSPVSGNWEDFVVNEVVSIIDSTYKTKSESKYRGISGYSMGGFGALNLSMKHPDVFGSVLVFCPGVFAEENISDVLASWKYEPTVTKSYAQAFSPNMDINEVFGNIPEFSGTEEDDKIINDWINGFSGWNKKSQDYLALNIPLNDIKIAYSEDDSYNWIPKGCKYISEIFNENGIIHSTDLFNGGHNVPFSAVSDYFIPFFNDIFKE